MATKHLKLAVSDASQLMARAFDGTPGGIIQEEIRS
jgi:hypothetical protein